MVERVGAIKRLVDLERGNIDGYSDQIQLQDSDAHRIAKSRGETLFEEASQRIDQVVLEAEVGLIDVAWERKQAKTDEIRELSEEKAGKLRTLGADFKRLMRDTGADSEGDK